MFISPPPGFLEGSRYLDELYLGTNHTFRVGEKPRPDMGGEYGIYLTPRRGYAARYGRNLYAALINIKRPYVVEYKGGISPRDLTRADIVKLLKAGYDSIVVTSSGLRQASEFVLFSPRQVHITRRIGGEMREDTVEEAKKPHDVVSRKRAGARMVWISPRETEELTGNAFATVQKAHLQRALRKHGVEYVRLIQVKTPILAERIRRGWYVLIRRDDDTTAKALTRIIRKMDLRESFRPSLGAYAAGAMVKARPQGHVYLTPAQAETLTRKPFRTIVRGHVRAALAAKKIPADEVQVVHVHSTEYGVRKGVYIATATDQDKGRIRRLFEATDLEEAGEDLDRLRRLAAMGDQEARRRLDRMSLRKSDYSPQVIDRMSGEQALALFQMYKRDGQQTPLPVMLKAYAAISPYGTSGPRTPNQGELGRTLLAEFAKLKRYPLWSIETAPFDIPGNERHGLRNLRKEAATHFDRVKFADNGGAILYLSTKVPVSESAAEKLVQQKLRYIASRTGVNLRVARMKSVLGADSFTSKWQSDPRVSKRLQQAARVLFRARRERKKGR